MKFQKEMEHVMSFPECPEKRGRQQAIMDLNVESYNYKNLNTARFVTGINDDGPNTGPKTDTYNYAEIEYWSAYLDTIQGLDKR